MTIKEVVDFYLADVEKVEFRIEMDGGMKGRDYILTKNEVYDFITGYENEEVVCTEFSTHYFSHRNSGPEVSRKKDVPSMYILYK